MRAVSEPLLELRGMRWWVSGRDPDEVEAQFAGAPLYRSG
jgi:hypothetical protein